jgi:hypothetical protein
MHIYFEKRAKMQPAVQYFYNLPKVYNSHIFGNFVYMDELIKIPSSEFNEEVFNKIKALLKTFGNAEVTIAVSNTNDSHHRNESKEEYWDRLNKSVIDIEGGKGITFTMDELEAYLHNKTGK